MKIRMGFVSNSSSEAFICRSGHSVKETKTILQEILVFYNKMFGTNYTFYETFEEPVVATKNNIDDLKENWSMTITPEDYTSVIIYSATDNSIPYSLFEIIEEKFEAKRLHLG